MIRINIFEPIGYFPNALEMLWNKNMLPHPNIPIKTEHINNSHFTCIFDQIPKQTVIDRNIPWKFFIIIIKDDVQCFRSHICTTSYTSYILGDHTIYGMLRDNAFLLAISSCLPMSNIGACTVIRYLRQLENGRNEIHDVDIDGVNQVYYLDRDNCVFRVSNQFPRRKFSEEHVFGTLVDGEMVIDRVDAISPETTSTDRLETGGIMSSEGNRLDGRFSMKSKSLFWVIGVRMLFHFNTLFMGPPEYG
uniref:mRNA capping enzyme adenylation domain-containing protein n=1 Tax=Strigamia maritima TaxID=126957 RepID=T1JP92_STRMM